MGNSSSPQSADYGEVTQRLALFLGYGALYENGEDSSVHVRLRIQFPIECKLIDSAYKALLTSPVKSDITGR
jgi:hypothetical protein